jgi:hypothetical protein
METGAFFLMGGNKLRFIKLPSTGSFRILQCGTTCLQDYPYLSQYIVREFYYLGRRFTITRNLELFEKEGIHQSAGYHEWEDVNIEDNFGHLDYKESDYTKITSYDKNFYSPDNRLHLDGNKIAFVRRSYYTEDGIASSGPSVFSTIYAQMNISDESPMDLMEKGIVQEDLLKIDQFLKDLNDQLFGSPMYLDTKNDCTLSGKYEEIRDLRRYEIRTLSTDLSFYFLNEDMPIYFPASSGSDADYNQTLFKTFFGQVTYLFDAHEWAGYNFYKKYKYLEYAGELDFGDAMTLDSNISENLASRKTPVRYDYLRLGFNGMNLNDFINDIIHHLVDLDQYKKTIFEHQIWDGGSEMQAIGLNFNQFEIQKLTPCERLWMITVLAWGNCLSWSGDNDYHSGSEFLINRLLKSFIPNEYSSSEVQNLELPMVDWLLNKLSEGVTFKPVRNSEGQVVDLEVDNALLDLYYLLDFKIDGDDNDELHKILYELWQFSSFNPYRNVSDSESIDNQQFDSIWTTMEQTWAAKGYPYTSNWNNQDGSNPNGIEHRPILVDYVSKKMYGFYMDSFTFNWTSANRNAQFEDANYGPQFDNNKRGIYWDYDGTNITILTKEQEESRERAIEALAEAMSKNNAAGSNIPFVSEWISKQIIRNSINLNEAFQKVNPERVSSVYHIFQPVSIACLNQNLAIQMPINNKYQTDATKPNAFDNFLPIFYLRYLDREGDRKDIAQAIFLSLDVVFTLLAVGNLLKLRHLYHLGMLRGINQGANLIVKIRIGFAVIDIASNLVSIWFFAFSSCSSADLNNDEIERCQNLGIFLAIFQLSAAGADSIANYQLRKSAARLKAKHPASLDEQTPEKIEAMAKLTELADFTGEAAEFIAELETKGLYSLRNRLINSIPTNGNPAYFTSEIIVDFSVQFRKNEEALRIFEANPSLVDTWAKIQFLKTSAGDVDFLKMYAKLETDLASVFAQSDLSATILADMMTKFGSLERVKEELAYALNMASRYEKLPGNVISRLSNGDYVQLTRSHVSGNSELILTAIELKTPLMLAKLLKYYDQSQIDTIMSWLLTRQNLKMRINPKPYNSAVVNGSQAIEKALDEIHRLSIGKKIERVDVLKEFDNGLELTEHQVLYITIDGGSKVNKGIRIVTDKVGESSISSFRNSFKVNVPNRTPPAILDLDEGLTGIDYTASGLIRKYPGTNDIMEVEIKMTGFDDLDFEDAISQFNERYRQLNPSFSGDYIPFSQCCPVIIEGISYTLHHSGKFSPVTGKCKIQLVQSEYHNGKGLVGYNHTGPKNDYLIYNRIDEYK